MYGTRARLCVRPSSANRRAICPAGGAITSDEVVTDPDAITLRILSLDDGAKELALVVAIREVDQRPGMRHVALRVAHDTHDGTRQHVLQRIHRVNDTQFERVEHDQ